MEQNRKHLKIASTIVLLFTAMSFLRVAIEFLFTEQGTAILPDGSSAILKLIVRIVLVAVSLVLLLPQIYVGVKGLRIAKNPTTAKGHIVWAYILLGSALLTLIKAVFTVVQNGSLSGYVFALVNGSISAAIYCYYIASAMRWRKQIG